MQISTFFPAEQINKFAISKDEYMVEAEGRILASEDGYAIGASDLFVLEQVNARGMAITT